jgi:hypothetical protein
VRSLSGSVTGIASPSTFDKEMKTTPIVLLVIGIILAMSHLTLSAGEEAPSVPNQISSLEGKWTTKKIEITDNKAFGAITAEDGLSITFNSKGSALWHFDLKASGQKPEMNLLYMVGASHIGFHGGPAGTTREVQVWHYQISDHELVLETVPKGAKLTFEKVKETAKRTVVPGYKVSGMTGTARKTQVEQGVGGQPATPPRVGD